LLNSVVVFITLFRCGKFNYVGAVKIIFAPCICQHVECERTQQWLAVVSKV